MGASKLGCRRILTLFFTIFPVNVEAFRGDVESGVSRFKELPACSPYIRGCIVLRHPRDSKITENVLGVISLLIYQYNISSTLQFFWIHIRERSKLRRNQFRRKGFFTPFRGIDLAVGSFSPKMGPKKLQSRVNSC